MSLDVVTLPQLRELAGPSYERGVRYVEDGRVLRCELTANGLTGVVIGTERYLVRVSQEDGEPWGECTCPHGVEVQLCKHAVALVLTYLSRMPATKAAPDTEPPGDGRLPAAGTFESWEDIDRWARANGVLHELTVCADHVAAEVARRAPAYAASLAYILGRFSLRELGNRRGATMYVGQPALVRAINEAVAARLETAASLVREAVASEQASTTPPADAQCARLWQRLREQRARLREHASPRPLARIPGELEVDDRAECLVWTEPTRVFTAATIPGSSGRSAEVRATLTLEPVESSCSCKAPACTHMLALVDATLALLATPARAIEGRQLASMLLRPAWDRALDALTAPATGSKPRSDIEVWWILDEAFGGPTLTPLVKKVLKRGGTSTGSRMSPLRLLDDYGDLLSEQDMSIAQHLAAWQPGRRGTTYPARAFVALVGHPRVGTEMDPGVPLSVRRVALGFTALPVGREIKLEPSVDGARFSPRLLDPLLKLHAPGEPLYAPDAPNGRCLLIDVSAQARKLWAVLSRYGDTFPEESHDKLMDRLAQLDRSLPLDVPEALMGSRLVEAPIVVVRLRLTPEGSLELQPFIRPAEGAPLYPPQVGPRDVLVLRNGQRYYARRDLGEEAPLVAGLLARLPLESAEEGPPGFWQIHDVDAALALVAAVQNPPPGLEAEWVDRKPQLSSSGGVENLTVRVQRKRDWFGIEGELKVEDGRIELAVLLDAARQQRRYVRLDERRWIELSDAVRERLRAIADQTFVAKHELELSPGAVPVIRALEAAGARVETAPSWQMLAERLAIAERLRPRPPAALDATLRPYQVEGHAWLARLAAWGAGACLADDMGLGKTIQAISVLLDRAKEGPALVLAPTSVTLNWVDELKRFAPSLRPVLYGEASDRAACIAKLTKRDVLIASYGLLVRDVELLAGRTFGTLVIDEAQALKNHRTQRAKAARSLDAGFRVALSGTPLENHLGELWSLFAIVFPGLLGSWEQFRSRFGVPIERDKSLEARQALSRLIRPFLLRRTKQEVARELPARTEIQVPIALSSEEAALYEDARLAALAQIGKKRADMRDEQQRFQVLAALTRLRLLASHPKLYDPTSSIASSKMQRLLELVDELRSEGHRALVFSQFTTHLGLAREALAEAGVTALYLDGATTARARADLIARFQRGEGDVFLISLKAGGTGINLTAADYVIHLDPWWNPAVEDQATDRAHRIGQTKPVTVYRLVSRGTVEEKIVSLHGDKRALVAGVLEGTDVAARLTTRDLIALVGDQPLTTTSRRSVAQA